MSGEKKMGKDVKKERTENKPEIQTQTEGIHNTFPLLRWNHLATGIEPQAVTQKTDHTYIAYHGNRTVTKTVKSNDQWLQCHGVRWRKEQTQDKTQ